MNYKKILFGLIVVMLLLTTMVNAFGGITHINTKINMYSEICIESVDADGWLYKILKFFHIPFYTKTNKTICDIDKVMACSKENPKQYDCQPDIIRECFRDCWSHDLEFDHYKYQLLIGGECWCSKEGIPMQIR